MFTIRRATTIKDALTEDIQHGKRTHKLIGSYLFEVLVNEFAKRAYSSCTCQLYLQYIILKVLFLLASE